MIFDGASGNTPLIGAYTGSQLPNGGVIQASGGALTLTHLTDATNTNTGFSADWSAYGTAQGPVAAFSSPSTGNTNVPIPFTDQSSNAATWLWDFGDGNTDTMASPTHTYSNPGIYTVVLEIEDAAGCRDSVSQVVDVLINSISDPGGMEVEVWPVPAQEEIFVRYRFRGQQTGTIRLVNVLGQPVFQGTFQASGEWTQPVPVARFARGIYFLKLESNEGNFVQKIVLE